MDRYDQRMSHPERVLEFSRRGWRCLSDDDVAAYLDDRLDDTSRRETESHLANCHACRSLIGDVIAMRRREILQLPLGLKERALSAALSARKRPSVLVPAFATAGFACLILAIFLLESPQTLNLPLRKAPAVPAIAKSDLPSRQGDGNSDIVRKPTQPETAARILFPPQDASLERSQLRFRWRSVSRAEYYEVRVVTSDGDPVWAGESKTNSVDLPTDLSLSDGTYFVWVGAMIDGQIKRSLPVRFRVRTSP
jgi:Putative zinc-finger